MVNIFCHRDYYTLHFLSGDRHCTFDLGEVPLKTVEQVKRCIEDLLASQVSGAEPDRETTLWLICLADAPYARLVHAGLAPALPSLQRVFEEYINLLVADRTTPSELSSYQHKSGPTET
jgi:hypothetical protein